MSDAADRIHMHEDHETMPQASCDVLSAPEIESTATLESDQQLLAEYAKIRSDAAFAQLVSRYVDFVYSTAFRQTGSHAMAQDVTQAVFIILARKAASLSRQTVLSGWLFRAVRYTVLDAHKMEKRRQHREWEAAQMEQIHSASDSVRAWEQLAPVLDDALAGLGEKDRHAVLLRFFEKKSFGGIGVALGGNENSARARVVRAVEKLRAYFHKRGVALTIVTISGLLLSNGAQAAPAGIAASVTTLAGGSGGGGALELLVRSVTRRLFGQTMLWVLLGVLAVLLIVGGSFWRDGLRRAAAERAEVAKQAEQTIIAQQARAAVAAIDRAFWLNQPDRVGQLVYFPTAEEEPLKLVFLSYLRAAAEFRQSLQARFPARSVQTRSFRMTLDELLAGQPRTRRGQTVLTPTRATDDSLRSHTVVLTKIAGEWKWDWLESLSPEARRERETALQQKTVLLDSLAQKLRDGTLTNSDEAFRLFMTDPAQR